MTNTDRTCQLHPVHQLLTCYKIYLSRPLCLERSKSHLKRRSPIFSGFDVLLQRCKQQHAKEL